MINLVKNSINKIIEFVKDERHSLEEKNFYCFITAIIIYCFCAAIVLFAIDSGEEKICFFLVMAVLSCIIFALARLLHKEDSYGLFYCIIINFLTNPLYFFMTGDIYSGAILFFLLGIIITVFLEAKRKFIFLLVAAELIVDALSIAFVFYRNDLFVVQRAHSDLRMINIICFVFVALMTVFICIYQSYVYLIAKATIDEGNRSISIAESSKTRFLANMTHEIRTPMNAIIGMTSLIFKEKLSPEINDQVNTINNAATQLLRIINNILEFSKLNSDKVTLIRTRYSFKELIKEITDSVAKEYEKDNIKFIVFIDKNIPDNLFGDDIRIKQIFNYLLFSALSQSENGTVILKIFCKNMPSEGNVTINVKLAITGAGFSEAEMNSIFNVYANYDSRQKSSYKGMGMELSICKELLNMMDGDLLLQSIEGIGTSVDFSFDNYVVSDGEIVVIDNEASIKPLVYIDEVQYDEFWQDMFENLNISASYARNITILKKQLENTRFTHIFVSYKSYENIKNILSEYECMDRVCVIARHSDEYGDYDDCKIIRYPVHSLNCSELFNNTWNAEDYKIDKKREKYTYPYAKVLLVDDSLVNIKVEESILANYDIESRFATSGYEALDMLKREKFDLVLLDQRMPEFDGIDTIHALRSSDYISSNVPVICVTAEFGNDIREKLIEEGFNDYIAKPINVSYLEHIFETFIPKELMVVVEEDTVHVDIKQEESNTLEKSEVSEDEITSFDPNIGISNLGGSKDAYISVLQTYYKEGNTKLINVQKELKDGDISLYTTDVHALKSSSATVGAMGISPLFKTLELAGKDNNTEYINANSDSTLEYFKTVLNKVKEYLISEDAFVDEAALDEEVFDDSNVVALDVDLVNELSNSITVMNLRRCEEIIEELSINNYGKEINIKVKEIKDSYENFDYYKIKDIVQSMLS